MVQRRTWSFIFSLCAGIIASLISGSMLFLYTIYNLEQFSLSQINFPLLSLISGILLILCSFFIYKDKWIKVAGILIIPFAFISSYYIIFLGFSWYSPIFFVGLLILFFGCVGGLIAEGLPLKALIILSLTLLFVQVFLIKSLIDVELDRQSMEQLKPHCEQLAKYACASSGGLHLPSQWSERIRYVVGTKSFSCEEVTKIHSCEDIDWKNW